MKRITYFAAMIVLLLSCGRSIETSDTTDISYKSATLWGQAKHVEWSPEMRIGFIISTIENPSISNGIILVSEAPDQDKKFFIDAKGLNSDTKYYFRAFLDDNGTYTLGNIKSFQTSAIKLDLVTKEATAVGYLAGTINGYYTPNEVDDFEIRPFFIYSAVDSTLDALKLSGERVRSKESSESFYYTIDDLTIGQKIYYVAAAKVYDKEVYGSVSSFTTEIRPATTGAVELGLSVKWADCNLGAKSPEDSGYYYAWGENNIKDDYSWSTYTFGPKTGPFKKYNSIDSFGPVDNKMVLDESDDVAHIKFGGKWRMPTDTEWTELLTKCAWTWTTQNGVNGNLVTAPNGNSIFLPALGYWDERRFLGKDYEGCYWSSSLYKYGPDRAHCLKVNQVRAYSVIEYRKLGYSIRPVSD